MTGAVDNGVRVMTFGCRLNAFESEVMRNRATEAGLGQLPGGAIVVNTCAVTGEAVRQARQAIRKARRENPNARIVVSGCAAQTEATAFGAMPEIDLVIGNDDKLHAHAYRGLPDFGVNAPDKVRVNDIMTLKTTAAHLIEGLEGRTRAFLQVQNGCDHRCTFCIIPYGRGPSRSVPADEVVEQAQRLADNGHLEIVLTGVDTTSWGADLPGSPKLGDLVAMVLRQVPGLPRLRLSSIDSVEIDKTLLEVIESEPRFQPHVHLSLQHGDDLILKRMKRRHSRAEAVAICDDLRRRRPDLAFGADLIAGFPTETEEMFAQSLSLIEECGLAHVHVFPFSPRPGTPAARMPQLDRPLVRERAERLRHAAAGSLARHIAAMHGSTVSVLMERDGFGRAGQYTGVRLDRREDDGIVEARVIGGDRDGLIAAPTRDAAALRGAA